MKSGARLPRHPSSESGEPRKQKFRRSYGHLTKQWRDEVSAGMEKGIRDTPAWKDAVRRLGIKEVRRLLRLKCLASQVPDANPDN